MKSFLLNFRVPAALLAALEKNVPKKEFSAFSRLAVAEKLARDFGEQLDASALAVRVGQGRRTDLERLRERIAAAEKTLAPYGGAAEIIRTGKGFEETAETLKELSSAEKDLINACPQARRLWKQAEKQGAAALEAVRKLSEIQRKEDAEQEERERKAGEYPANGTPEEQLKWDMATAEKITSLKKWKAEFERKEKLEKRRVECRKKYFELVQAAHKAAREYAENGGRGDKAAGK